MTRSRFVMGYDHHNMTPSKAGTSVDQVIWNTEDGIMDFYGTGTPPTTASKYAEGCVYHKVNDTNEDTLYVNIGTYASPNFVKLAVLETASAAGDNGPSPLLWDGAPLFETMINPARGYYYFNDMMEVDVSGSDGAGTLTVTKRTSGSVANSLIQGGGIILDAGAATTAQGITAQLITLGVLPEDGTTIRMEWRMSNDEGAGRIAMGLGAVGTTAWVSDDTMATDADHAMFFKDGGTTDTAISASNSDGSNTVATDDVFTSQGTGFINYGIKIVGNGTNSTDSVDFYVDGVAATHADTQASIPDGIMVPTFETNADGTDQPVFVLDWLRILVTHATDGSRA